MSVRIFAANPSAPSQPKLSFSELLQDGMFGMAWVLSGLLGMLAWLYLPDVMTVVAIVGGVLLFIYAISVFAVRFGPSTQALEAMSMSSSELCAVIKRGH